LFSNQHITMIASAAFQNELDLIIKNAVREDVGMGDHSTLACISVDKSGKAQLLVKQTAIIAGIDFARRVFEFIDPNLKLDILIEDGKKVQTDDIVFYVEGNAQAILKAERIVLNAMQHMSAIATKTAEYVAILKNTQTKILDTRKTILGVRALEKWAVKIGGGENHRFGLYDMIILKDNHIDFVGGITKAIEKSKNYLASKNLDLKIIVEARDLNEVTEILKSTGVFRILLDNFNLEETRKAIAMINGKCQTESSGGITLENLKDYADCGVDFISSGALTHSVSNIDLSLNVKI